MKQARGVSILWINPYASLKQIARAIDFSRSPLRHRPCVPVRLVLGIHHRPLLKVLARLFQIPLLCLELRECLKQMRVQGIQFASLGQELLRAVAIPELGFPHPPREPNKLALRGNHQTLLKKLARLLFVARVRF